MRDLQAARRAPLNPSAPAGAEGPGSDDAGRATEHRVDAGTGDVPAAGSGEAGAALDPAGATTTGPADGAAPTLGERPPPRLWPLCSSVALLGLAVDVYTKFLAVQQLEPGVGVPLLGGLLTLRLIRNPGAAFSTGEGVTWVFAVAAILVLGFVLIRLVPRLGHIGWAVALGLLVAGVSGNLVDRLFRAPAPFRGHVVDFLQLPHWPIFNVADMCITSAAVLVVVLSVIKNVGIDGRRGGETPASSPASS
ncbi:hypothetical protein GCM10022197_16540 [Microlunatus spumicola]|uniref:Lipoprotein signal peptidase n=1 Tax=Microlunatus spumicola TaxID=81499 RepID=A0ABP6X654_9ACTN